jgi:hypothetical protein
MVDNHAVRWKRGSIRWHLGPAREGLGSWVEVVSAIYCKACVPVRGIQQFP